MKKRISIIIVTLMLLFTGCVKNTGVYKPIENNNDRFQIIYTQTLGPRQYIRILYDKESNLKYIYVSEGNLNCRSIELIKIEE